MTDGAIDYGRYGKLLGLSLLCFLAATIVTVYGVILGAAGALAYG